MAALLNIDDRDTTINIHTVGGGLAEDYTADVYKDWLNMLKAEAPAGSVAYHIGKGNYVLILPAVVCTGAAVTTILNIPFMHELYKIELKHTDAAGADSTDAMAYAFSHRINGNLWLRMLYVAASTASDIVDQYVDYYHVRGEYKIDINTTATDKVHVVYCFRILGE